MQGVLIIVILVVIAAVGIYATMPPAGPGPTPPPATTSTTGSVSTSVSTSGGIPPNTLIIGEVGLTWGANPIGTDITMMWPTASSWPVPVYEQLFQFDPAQMKNGEYELVPWLAESATASADGTTWTISLRQGVRFHTGNVMTATDVQYSLNRFIFFNDYPLSVTTYPGYGLGYRASFASFKNVSVVSPYQIKVTLNYPDATFLQELASPGASIVDMNVLESHAVRTSNSSDHGFAWFNAGQDMGTGPFMLTSFTLQQRAELTKYTQYWGGIYNTNTPIQKIIFIPIADATTGRFALESGQINILDNAGGQVVNAISQTGRFNILTTPGFGRIGLYFHPAGPLADWRVRQAIKFAIDYNGLISAFTYGYDIPNQSQFYKGMPGWQESAATYYSSKAPDITQAKALLAEAGYPNGFSTDIFVLPNPVYGVNAKDWATVIQSDLAKVGINLKVNVVSTDAYVAMAVNLTQTGMLLVPSSLVIFSPQSNFDQTLGSGNTAFIGWNAASEKGPNIDFTYLYQTWNKSKTETNPTLQIQEMQTVDEYILKYGCLTPIVQIGTKVAYATNIQGLVWNSVNASIDTTYVTIS